MPEEVTIKPAPEPVEEMILVKKDTCIATVRKADLPVWEKNGYKAVDPEK